MAKRKKKLTKKQVVKRLDKLFSELVRREWKRCPFCNKPSECCFHFVTRTKYSVRWSFINTVGSCRGCNFKYEHDPHFAIQWFIETSGLNGYFALLRQAEQRINWTIRRLREKLVYIEELHAKQD